MACQSVETSAGDESQDQLVASVWGDNSGLIWKTGEGKYQEDDIQMEEILDEQADRRRKSSRRRMKRRPFSPDKITQKKVKTRVGMPSSAKRRRRVTKPQTEVTSDRPCDRLANGTPFCCDLCKSPYVCNRGSKQGQSSRQTKYMPSPRHKVDPLTGRMLRLCNACGLAFDRSDRPRKARVLPPQEDKDKYLEEAKQFGQRLSVELNDPDAERLYCPQFKFKACGCLQSYILFEGEQEHSNMRAEKLLKLVKEAKQLRTLKYYSQDEAKKPQRSRNIGLGNGMKKSKLFEEFVMEKRQYLKDTLKLCERAAQRILIYSNNFIHKKLKSEDSNCRARRVIGKAALGLLPPLSELDKKKCCIDKCVMVATTHSRLLQEWRDRATQGQQEARRVLAEMLTPSGGARSNCYKFISMVTGCSPSLIGCVNDQMRRTGGDRKPPTHGMKKFWQVNQRRAKDATIAEGEQEGGISGTCNHGNSTSCGLSAAQTASSPNDNGTVDSSTASTSYQFEMQRQQLLQLQRQLTEQQNQIQQHQQLVQQQLLQQTLLQQLAESGSCTQVIQTQPASTVNVPTPSVTGPGLANGVQPLIISTNQLPALDTSPILLPSLQAPFTTQATSQQTATLLPGQQSTPAATVIPQQFTPPQSTVLATPSIPQQQQQQQPMQTVQVMIANIELPIQQGQAAVQLLMPSQQQAQQTALLQTHPQNTLLQSQQQQQQPAAHIVQQQPHLVTQQQQQQPTHIIQQGPLIPHQQQQHHAQQQHQQQDAMSSQTLSLPLQLRPPEDHTYSQSQPPPTQVSVHSQPPPTQAFAHSQPSPTQVSAHSQPPPTQVSVHSQPPPTQVSVHSQPPQTQVTVYSQPSPTQVSTHSQPPPTQVSVHSQPPPTQISVHSQPPPTQISIHSQPPPTEISVHSQPPPSQVSDHSQPPPTQVSVQQHPVQIEQQPLPYQVVQGHPCSVEALSKSPIASVSMPSAGSNSGFSVNAQPTQASSSPLQMLASFTAEPYDVGGQTLQPSRGGSWPASCTTSSILPLCGVNPNPVQSQTLSLATPALNLQSVLHQIFSIVNMNGGTCGLASGSMAADIVSPASSPTKPESSPTLPSGTSGPSSQPLSSVTTETSSSSSVDGELTCNVFMQQEQPLTDSACLTQSDHQVAAGVGELQQNCPETQESPSGEVTSSPSPSDMINLLPENCG